MAWPMAVNIDATYADDPTDASRKVHQQYHDQIQAKLNGEINVEADFGAVPDEFFTDGVANATTTFTSATANFVAGDVGKTIVILRAGASNYQDHHTTIATRVSATQVTLTHAAQRSQSSARFYISRAGDQTTPIQAAIDAASTAGGMKVKLPGVGYLTTGLTHKNRVWLAGRSMAGTLLHLAASSNRPVIATDTTLDNSAMTTYITDIWVDGNRARQSDTTTTLGAGYTAGSGTATVADASVLFPSGSVLIGTNRLTYESVTGNVLNNVAGGTEGTTDANASNGATVTQHKAVGIYQAPNPFNTNPTTAEQFDPHHLVQNVKIKNCKGDGIQAWGQSDIKWINLWVSYCDQGGFRPAFDTTLHACTAETVGRWGYLIRGSNVRVTNCTSFYCGGNVAAEGWGYIIEGPTSLEEGIKVLSGVSAQDNKADGFYLRTAQRVVLQGVASSNGTGGPAGTYAGVKIDGCTNGIVDVACTERRVDGSNNWQQNALYILNTAVTTTGMQIRIAHGATAGATVGTAIKSGSALTGGNSIQINSQGGTVTPAYATPYTPDPYVATFHVMAALTGNLTINAPANAHLGAELVISLNASGGTRTITWNAAFVNTPGTSIVAGAYLTGRFVYNGTNWVGV